MSYQNNSQSKPDGAENEKPELPSMTVHTCKTKTAEKLPNKLP